MRISDWSSDVCSSDLDEGREAVSMTASQLKTDVLAKNKEVEKSAAGDDTPAPQTGNPEAEFLDWKDQLLTKLRSIDPSAFERLSRSEERRVGKECVSTCRYRWWRQPKKKKKVK